MSEDTRTFGYDAVKDAEKISVLKKWYTCSFCGRLSEVRPHAPFSEMPKVFPMRLCAYCAQCQHNLREMIKSIALQ